MFVKIVAAVALAGATLCLAGQAASAAAPATAPAAARPQAERVNPAQVAGSYTVYNATGVPLTIANHWMDDGDWDGDEPVNGTVIEPGFSFHFGVVEWFARANQATIDFQLGQQNQYVRVVGIPQFADGMKYSSLLNPNGAYTFSLGGLYNSTLAVTSAQPTVHNLTDDQGQQQYDVLRNVCADNTQATCTFTPTSEASTLADPELVGPVIPNPGNTEVTEKFDWEHTTETTTEWGTEAKLSAGLEGIVTAEVSAHYGQSYSNSVSVSGGIEVPIEPGYTGWLTYAAPVERVTGDFTITLGNDTWHLSHVHFDLPKNDNGSGGVLTPNMLPNGNPGIPSGTVNHTLN